MRASDVAPVTVVVSGLAGSASTILQATQRRAFSVRSLH
jgi:hypothetical protein